MSERERTPEATPISDDAFRIATQLVREWDLNNAICLLDDHRADLVFNIAKQINAHSALVEAVNALIAEGLNYAVSMAVIEQARAALALAETEPKGK